MAELINERLQQAFANAKISQAELARRAEIDRASVSLYLSGRYQPKAEKLLRLAAALEVSPEWLCGTQTHSEAEEDVKIPVLTGLTEDGALRIGTQTITLPRQALGTHDASRVFVFRMTGMSMYPAILEGDWVFICRQDAPQEGKYALFNRDGAPVVRRVQGATLVPVNPEYPPHPLDERVRFLGHCFGLMRDLN